MRLIWKIDLVAALVPALLGLWRVIPEVDRKLAVSALNQVWNGPPHSVPSQPKVLLVSLQETDRFSVRATVEPRGYSLLLADNTERGIEILSREREQIAIVVIDLALPHSKRLLRAIKLHCPRAHLTALRGPRRIGEVSALLINTAVH